MKIELSAIVATATVIWWRVKVFWDFWSPVIEEIVAYIEELAKDKVIDKSDRKKIALKAIDLIALKKGKKIGLLERMLINWLIEKYAGKLIPHDITIPIVVDEAKK